MTKPAPSSAAAGDDVQALARLHSAAEKIRQQLSRVIIGQTAVIEELLAALFSGGHCLLVGVPGLAKTLMVRTLAGTLSLQYSRIQFTPDLMPSDITGTEVIFEDRTSGERSFRFLPGPVFANIILADEINRTPPKTQAALLEAMQEGQVTAGGAKHELPHPFFVLATQNPIEQEGTYPLPEAQLDRFMFQVWIDYPSAEDELDIVLQTTSQKTADVEPVLTAEEIIALAEVVRKIPVAEHVAKYAVDLARRSRPQADDAPAFVKNYVQWGAGPRASQYLVLGAKAKAALAGHMFASIADVQSVAVPVLRHRLRTNFNADAEGIAADVLVRRLVKETPIPNEEAARGNARVFRSAHAGPA
jgi:MoxR-like ATPase